MAHRGRLNVLVNTLGKMPKDLFAEFDDTRADDLPSGDVKYHQGFSRDITTPGGPVHLSLAFNPSHLEIVNPVVEGSVQGAHGPPRRRRAATQVLPVLVHGDAAFAGQGVVMETLNLAQTRGYYTGGTVHIVINNQIGFTTSDPRDTRSTLYCTDVVKMIEAPVLHVNGDDPEAVRAVHAARARLPAGVQQGRGRRHRLLPQARPQRAGHAGADAAADVQEDRAAPGHAQAVRRQAGRAGRAAGRRARRRWSRRTAPRWTPARARYDPVLTNFKSKYAVDWAPFLGKKWTDAADTARAARRAASAWPSASRRSRRTSRCIRWSRRCSPTAPRWAAARCSVDWGMGEHLAFASLVASGYAVRLSGEDSGRGTFTHRHAVLHDQNRERWDDGTYMPLQNVADGQAPFVVIDSLLSEEAVLGFEYGYSTRRAEHARHLGSAVRRLRQRRAGRDRPVHRLGRGEVGPRQRPDADAAARLRRPGPGALVGAPRALPAAVRPTTTCRSCSRPRRARSSTCCAARWCACSASR